MKAMSTCLVCKHKKVVIFETRKGLLAKSNAELLSGATRKETKSVRIGDRFIETIPSTYLGFVIRVE